jgi:hypothetical protein
VLPPPPAPWRRRTIGVRAALRAVPALLVAVAIATSVVRSHERADPAPQPPPAPAGETATAGGSSIVHVYGDPTPSALRAASGNAAARRVCLDEIRPLPTSGLWKCHSWEQLDASSIGRRAKDVGGPCTHRVADGASGVWNCWTRIAIPALALGMPYAVPVMFGHLLPAASASQEVGPPPRICRAESRSSGTSGAWTCVSAQQVPDGWRLAEPVDPGGPCTYRVADEETGVWSCQSATAQDARAGGG